MLQLIRFNKVTGELEINIGSVYYVPDIAIIMTRLKPSMEDTGGQLKIHNKKEMMYIFYMADWTSVNYLQSLPDDIRHDKARVKLNFPMNGSLIKLLLMLLLHTSRYNNVMFHLLRCL